MKVDVGLFLWALFYLVGNFFFAAVNVTQEKFLKIRKDEEKRRLNESLLHRKMSIVHDMLHMCFFTSILQLILVLVCFFVDLIPYVGSSRPDDFIKNMISCWDCLFQVRTTMPFSECTNTWWLFLLSLFGVYLQSISAGYLNTDSADFTMVAQQLIQPSVIIFWAIDSAVTHDASEIMIPVWAIVLSFIFLVFATILWKFWERREQRQSYSMVTSKYDDY